MFLIVMGGLGFPVWHDIATNVRKIGKERKRPLKWLFTRLSLQSRIVIVMTLSLILFGTLCFFIIEFENPATMKDMNVFQKIMASMFQSVTTRTAGYATVSQAGLEESSKLIGCILMFV